MQALYRFAVVPAGPGREASIFARGLHFWFVSQFCHKRVDLGYGRGSKFMEAGVLYF